MRSTCAAAPASPHTEEITGHAFGQRLPREQQQLLSLQHLEKLDAQRRCAPRPHTRRGSEGEDANDTNDIVYGLPAKAFDFILPDIAFIENIQFS